MLNHNPSPHSDPDALTRFHQELARAVAMPGLAPVGAALWPRFAGYYQGLARLPRRLRRALQRQWRRSLGGIALLCALGQAPALAATIAVDGTNCTLVDAVTAANTNQPTGGCPAGSAAGTFNPSGLDTITLPAGSTHRLTAVNINSGFAGLVVTSAIIIDGNGSTITRDPGAPQFGILEVAEVELGGDLTLKETTVSGGVSPSRNAGGVTNFGVLTLINSTVSGNSAADGGGGGVASFGGTLTLMNSTVSGNSAQYGGGLLNSGTLTLTDSTVTGNYANDHGGGISNYNTLTLVRTLVSGNYAYSQGSEVFNYFSSAGSGTVNADDFNLFGSDGSAGVTGFTPGVTDIVPSVSLDAILDPALATNGGPTRTHALVTGSPAIDAVPAVPGDICARDFDQRGIARPQDGDEDTVADCDIGAFELEPPPPPPPPPVEPPPPPPVELPPPPPIATALSQNPQLGCTGSACRVPIRCDAVAGTSCSIEVKIFVPASTLRLSDDPAAKARRRLLFASGVARIPAGQIANVKLKLRKAGKQIVRTSTRKRIRGGMEIRNSTGAVGSTRIRIRLP